MSQISRHFFSEEFIPEEIHNYITNNGYDPRWYCSEDLVGFLEWVKDQCNGAKITLNTYKWFGVRNWSGLRVWLKRLSWDKFKYGDGLSQHRFINAVDFIVDGYNPKQIEGLIRTHYKYVRETFSITTIENTDITTNWNHVDTRWTGLDYLFVVNPS